jgi:tRNA-2-methylthio-N6-dimethylallyladenosine synthase
MGQTMEVLVERTSKKNEDEWSGRNDQNIVIIFPKENYKLGDYVDVKVNECTTGTLIGEAVGYAPYWQE